LKKISEVKQLVHIGYDPENGFNFNNIPEQWKGILGKFQGIEKQLENPNVAKSVFSILQEAEKEAEKTGELLSLDIQLPSTIKMNIPPPPPPPPSTSQSNETKESISVESQIKEVKLKPRESTEPPKKIGNNLQDILIEVLGGFRPQIDGNDLDVVEEGWSDEESQ